MHSLEPPESVPVAIHSPSRHVPLASRQMLPSFTVRGGLATVQISPVQMPTLQASSMHGQSSAEPKQELTIGAG